MRWLDGVRRSWRDLRRRERRAWAGVGRLYVQSRSLPVSMHEVYARGVEEIFRDVPEVHWAHFNAALGRVVIAHEKSADVDRLALRVDGLDSLLDLQRYELTRCLFPADEEPLVRARIGRAADAIGVGIALLRTLVGAKTTDTEIDVAATLFALDNIPLTRALVSRRLGEELADVLLAGLTALAGGLTKGALGPATDLAVRQLRIRSLEARRAAWAEMEPRIGAAKEAHAAPPQERAPRPVPLPEGPLEAYTERAVLASLGGFGLGLTASRSIASATAPLFIGVPRPARLGREAFVAELSRRMAERSILVVCDEAVRVLDKVTCLLMPSELLAADQRGARSLVPAAHAAELRVVAYGGDPGLPDGASPDERLDGVRDHALAIRSMQRRGHVVCAVVGDRACFAADVTIGLLGQGGAQPWQADLLCENGLEDLLFVIAAIEAAREAARQGVRVSVLEGAAGLFLSARGLRSKNVSEVALAANIATLFAIGNAVRLARQVEVRSVGGPRREVAWHATDKESVLKQVASRPDGLTREEAAARRETPPEPPSRRDLVGRFLIDELTNPLMPVLAAGAGLSALTGAVVDAGLIGGVVAFNAALGVIQRLSTEEALAEFGSRESRSIRVRRGDRVRTVEPGELVVGDVIELQSGEVVPADCRLLESRGLEMEESSLTGESLPVAKSSSRPVPKDAPVAERTTMVFESTMVAAGEATAVAVAIGDETEARRGFLAAHGAQRSGVEERLSSLTSFVAPVAALSGVAMFAAGLSKQRPAAEVIGSGVSLAVAAVPEGLPLLATIAQLAAARRLAKRGALVRNPRAVEALGRVEVLCADKTGTLTEGRIRLRLVTDGDRERPPAELDDALARVLVCALRAAPPINGLRMAHPTDQALQDGAGGHAEATRPPAWTRTSELAFEPGRGYHAVVGQEADGLRSMCVKGAPEVLLPRCVRQRRDGREAALDETGRAALMSHAEALADRGLRVLAVAEGAGPTERKPSEGDVTDLTLLGFIGLADTVRATAKTAIAWLREAGVQVLMVTGDHPGTARAIGAELGLDGAALTGSEVDALDDDALARALTGTDVFARVTPVQKVRIVCAFQRLGKMVAMTGDGANDAPAIRLADVGIAMGERATSAARDAADLVVTDERIETLVTALLEGRALWSSVRDAVAILVGGNLGEILYTVTSGLARGRSPLNTRQLLLVNMLTDTLPAIAVALHEPTGSRPELLREGPDASLGDVLVRDIVWRAIVTSGAATITWLAARPLGTTERADTIALLTLVGGQLGQTLVAAPKSPLVIASSLGSLALLFAVVETPYVSQFFGCRPLGPLALSHAAVGIALATAAGIVAPRIVGRLAPHFAGPARVLRREVSLWQHIVRDISIHHASPNGRASVAATAEGDEYEVSRQRAS